MNLRRSITKRINKALGNDKIDPKIAPVQNVYNTNYTKRALISYITSPFRFANQFTHQNFITSHIIAESFSELGYDVDVVEYLDDKSVVAFDEYDVIFGFGAMMERSFYSANRSIPRISFITGAHDYLHNEMCLKSITDFYSLSGVWLPEEADVLSSSIYYSMFNADITIILARGYVFDQCKSVFNNRLYSLNNNIIGSFADFQPKDIGNRNTNFLFLSGSRLLKKGLYILLEVAKIRTDLNFYVVVPYMTKEFESYYKAQLHESPNVFFYRNLRMDSLEMKEIVEKCTYSVTPSYIDGFPGGTIEPMSAGLIPIVSRYCGFASEEFIFEMEELTPSSLIDTIDEVLALDDDTYTRYSTAVKEYAIGNFSASNVKRSLLDILRLELETERRGAS